MSTESWPDCRAVGGEPPVASMLNCASVTVGNGNAAVVRARSAPPSDEANNQDLFVWALFVLGGADRDVDVEEVYLKSFELAPARLGWRTRPEIPDYKKTAKALQSVESTSHPGLIAKRGPYQRRLTSEGVAWVERNRPLLAKIYGGRVPEVSVSALGQRRAALRGSAQFLSWKRGQGFDPIELADALECSPASPTSVWEARIDELVRVARVTQDPELAKFAEEASQFLRPRAAGGGEE